MANYLDRNPVASVCWSRPLRSALASGVAILFVASIAGDADAAVRKTKRNQEQSSRATRKKEEPKLPFGNLPKGPMQIVVSTGSQHATLYVNGQRIEQTRVSTGTPSKPTPHGVFSVIEKDRYHHSNLYGDAPMFYMHRLTWSGVAMHEGSLPGFAASHGCIRMPTGFVSRLWQVSKLGLRVVVARNDPEPHEFSHAKLFNPAQRPAHDQVSDAKPGLRSSIADDVTVGSGGRPVVLALAGETADTGKVSDAVDPSADQIKTTPSGEPPTGAGATTDTTTSTSAGVTKPAEQTVSGEADTTASTTKPVTAETKEAPAKDPAIETTTVSLPNGEPEKHEATGAEPSKPAPNRKREAEPVKRTGQVAVFISKKEKKIFVRQGFVPLFDMPIEIAHPEQPLGTHVFTALEVIDDGAHMRWNAISMAADAARADVSTSSRKKNGRKSEPAPKHPVEVQPASTAAQALDRVTIPQAAIDRISELLIPGSSLIISDQGLGNETGRYTEFVVVTR